MESKAASENLEHYIREAQLILDKYATQNHVSRYLQSPYDPAEIEERLNDRVQSAAVRLGKALAELQAWLQDQTSVRPVLRKQVYRPRRRPGGGRPKTP